MTGALQLVEPGTGRQLSIPVTCAPNPAPWDDDALPGEALEDRWQTAGSPTILGGAHAFA